MQPVHRTGHFMTMYIYCLSCHKHVMFTKLSMWQITNCVWCMGHQLSIGPWPPVLQVLRRDVLWGEVVSPSPNSQVGGPGLYL